MGLVGVAGWWRVGPVGVAGWWGVGPVGAHTCQCRYIYMQDNFTHFAGFCLLLQDNTVRLLLGENLDILRLILIFTTS